MAAGRDSGIRNTTQHIHVHTHTHTHDVPKEPEGRKRGSKDERREQLGP